MRALVTIAALLLAACRTTPPCPDWRDKPNPLDECCVCEPADAGCGVELCRDESGEACRPCADGGR